MTDPASSPASPPRQEKILLVDDTPINLQMLHQLLNGRGYQLRMAKNAEDALRIAKKERPDLILLDIIMPGMDGFETCRLLKEDPETQNAAVIFMSALSETDSKVRGLEVGAVDYITKPFESAEVLARVHTHLTIQRLQASLAKKNEELGRANEFIRKAFGRYVSEEVAQSVLESPEGLDLGGEEREVTILMSDLRGFTAMVNRLPPKEVLELLNLYLEAMVEVIGEYQGTIIEILGDSFLVMYGAPIAFPDHPDRAVASAVAMQLAMVDVNRRLMEREWPTLEMGIGVHTGRTVVGNIGSERRSKYAAVGTTVNLAGRIESFTVGGQVLISEATRVRVKAPLRLEGRLHVEPKGVTRTLQLGVVAAIGPPYDLELPGQDRTLYTLPRPLPMKFTVLHDKAVRNTQNDGVLLALSEREARFAADHHPAPLENLKLDLSDDSGFMVGEAYVKVLQQDVAVPGTTLVRFTSLSSEMRAWLRSHLPAQMDAGVFRTDDIRRESDVTGDIPVVEEIAMPAMALQEPARLEVPSHSTMQIEEAAVAYAVEVPPAHESVVHVAGEAALEPAAAVQYEVVAHVSEEVSTSFADPVADGVLTPAGDHFPTHPVEHAVPVVPLEHEPVVPRAAEAPLPLATARPRLFGPRSEAPARASDTARIELPLRRLDLPLRRLDATAGARPEHAASPPRVDAPAGSAWMADGQPATPPLADRGEPTPDLW